MNFSIHLDDACIARLSEAVERTGLSRNRLIAQAVREWLERNEESQWPPVLAQHFRNPAPELAQETLDAGQWQDALAHASPRW